MQIVDCNVRIGGSVLHVVPKQDVTPAEIIVLQQIHGTDAVQDVRPKRMDKRSHTEEFDRLRRTYGRNGLQSVDGEPSVLLDRLFPGAIKRLPVTLKDIGMGHLITGGKAPEPKEEANGGGEEATEDAQGGEAAGEGDA